MAGVALLFVVQATGQVDALSRSWAEMVQRRMIVYSAKGDIMIKTSPTWVDANGDTNRVTTEMGVTPPAKLVPADWGDLTNETPEDFDARHRARVARAQEIWPPV